MLPFVVVVVVVVVYLMVVWVVHQPIPFMVGTTIDLPLHKKTSTTKRSADGIFGMHCGGRGTDTRQPSSSSKWRTERPRTKDVRVKIQHDVRYFPSPIPDDIPTDDEIFAAVQRLRAGKAPGPTGLKVDDLQRWAKQRDGVEEWIRLVDLVRQCFASSQLPQQLCHSILVILPRPDGGLRGIGLLEVVWKVISMIFLWRMENRIKFDDSLHGFLTPSGHWHSHPGSASLA